MLGKNIQDVVVEGFGSPQLIKEMAAKAGVRVTASMIEREGAGRYNLKLDAKTIASMLKPSAEHDADSELLSHIRTGEDMEKEIAKAQNPPGYTRTLDRAQAQGSLYLRSCGSGVLAFAPGVGKTDTAIGAALELMNSEPDKHHRVLIVAPATAMANAWAKTIQQTCPGKSLAILGVQGPEAGGEDSFDWRGKLKDQPTRTTQPRSRRPAAASSTVGDSRARSWRRTWARCRPC
jgi:hypothetical protein